MALGLTGDQVAIFKKEMYDIERETPDIGEPKYREIFKIKDFKSGAGTKFTQTLVPGDFTRHTVENQDINFRSPTQGWTSRAKFHTFSDGLVFSKEAIEDVERLGNQIKELAKEWTELAQIAKEEFAARYFNRGSDTSGDWLFLGTWADETDSSGLLAYDSKPIFNLTGNERTTKGGGTFYTSIASLTMTVADFATAYHHITATNNRDEMNRLRPNPVNTIICYPGDDVDKAERIVMTQKGLPGSELNDINPHYKRVDKIIDWDYLDSAGGFYIGRRQDRQIEFCERQGQETDFFRDNNNRAYKASCDIRFGLHVRPLSWRAWVKCGGTTVAGGATE